MFEPSSEIGDSIADTAREVKARVKQVTGMVTGDDDLEARGRGEARAAAIEDFRDDLRVEQAREAGDSSGTRERC
ncbi:CsbD family protein [Nocardia takedensis]